MLEFVFQMSMFVLFILIYFTGSLIIVAIKIITINTNNTELFCFSSKEVKTLGCTSGAGVM